MDHSITKNLILVRSRRMMVLERARGVIPLIQPSFAFCVVKNSMAKSVTILRDKRGCFIRGCNIATLNKGIKKPVGFGEKISAYKTGKKLSQETRNKLSISLTGNKNGVGNKSHSGKF